MKFWSSYTWTSAGSQAQFKAISSKCMYCYLSHWLNTCTWLLLYRYVGVVFDEMYIREDLVLDKHLCRLVGFVNVADFGNQMQHLEEMRSDLVSSPHVQAIKTFVKESHKLLCTSCL